MSKMSIERSQEVSYINSWLRRLIDELKQLIANMDVVLTWVNVKKQGDKFVTVKSHKSGYESSVRNRNVIDRGFDYIKRGFVWIYRANCKLERKAGHLALANNSFSLRIHNVNRKINTIFTTFEECRKSGNPIRFIGVINDQPCDISIQVHTDKVSKPTKKPRKKLTNKESKND